MLKHKFLLVVPVWLLLASCNGDNSTPGSGNGSSLSFCAARNLYSEAQLIRNPALFPNFDDSVLVDLETSSESSISSDSDTPGIDQIHYRLENADSLDFGFQSTLAESAVLEDNQGNVLFSLNSGESVQDFALSAGDYFLKIQSKNVERGTLVVQPSGCSSLNNSSSVMFRSSMTTSYSHPGVYITELPSTQAVTPMSTSVTAFVGAVPQGPLNTPTLINTFNDYTQSFGALNSAYPMGFALLQFFNEGGQSAYVSGVSSQAYPSSELLIGSSGLNTGLYALREISGDWNLLVIPDLINLDPSAAAEVVESATLYTNEQNSFFIQDPPAGMEDSEAILSYVSSLSGLPLSGSAIYFPYLQVENPLTGSLSTVGAAATMAGIYAQVDVNEGVWASPADIALEGVEGLSLNLTDQENGILNPQGINAIRNFPGRGIVVWGSRTLSDSYVSEARLRQFLMKTIQQNLQWTVFQANDQRLWITVTQLLNNFMTTLWQAGAFYGASASDAFYIICDSSNNTPETILNGYLNVTIGYAPIYPAEFEVIQLSFIMAD